MKENDLDPDVTAQYRAGLLTKFEYLLIKHRLRRIRKLLQFLHSLRVYIWFRFWWGEAFCKADEITGLPKGKLRFW